MNCYIYRMGEIIITKEGEPPFTGIISRKRAAAVRAGFSGREPDLFAHLERGVDDVGKERRDLPGPHEAASVLYFMLFVLRTSRPGSAWVPVFPHSRHIHPKIITSFYYHLIMYLYHFYRNA
jgi:hypothetical protein